MDGMNRPPSKDKKGPRGRGNGRSAGMRTPPPSVTGLEGRYYEQTINTGTRVVLSLADGRTVRGVLKEYDRDQVTVEQDSGCIVVRKSNIRYISED